MSMSRRRMTATVALGGAAVFAAAQLVTPAEAESGDEAAVTQAVEAFRKAMLADDRAAFEKLCAPQMSYGHSSGRLQA